MDITAADMVALLRRTTDEQGWLQPLLDDPDSAVMVNALTEMMGRLGSAAIHNRDAMTIGSSSGGQFGTCLLTLSRVTTGTSGTIPASFPFIDARGVQMISQTDVPVTNGQATIVVPVQTLRETELVNTVDDPVVRIDDAVAPAIKDTGGTVNLIAATTDPANAATTFLAVPSATPIVGGAVDWLSVHGSERSLLRQAGEGESDYRQRIRNIVDAVTPFAIGDLVFAVAQQLGLPAFLVREPFNDGADPALKTAHALSHFDGVAVTADVAGGGDFLDDPTSGLVLLDRREVTGYFDIQAQDFVADPDNGTMYWDDAFADDTAYGYPDSVLEFPPIVLAALLSMIQSVQRTKGIGINFDVILKEEETVIGGP